MLWLLYSCLLHDDERDTLLSLVAPLGPRAIIYCLDYASGEDKRDKALCAIMRRSVSPWPCLAVSSVRHLARWPHINFVSAETVDIA